MTEVTKQKCRQCDGELIRDEKRKCLFCPICHPPSKTPIAAPKKAKGLIDVAMTEKMVREIVRDELENWHIQKPSVTKSETSKLTATEVAEHQSLNPTPVKLVVEKPNWRQQAKELGIELFHRKKADVIAEIKARTSGLNSVPTDGGQ